MFLEILGAVFFGVIFGTITGLIPGIHVNLVAVILLSTSGFLLSFVGIEVLIAFIVAMAITHTFLDTIPSIFLGAPDGATALSVLPGHRLLLEGKGLEAVKLTIIGSLFGLIFSTVLYLLLEQVLSVIYPVVSNYIGEMLFIVALFIIMKNKKVFRASFVFIVAGILGLLTLNSRIDNALFPLLTGFFGLSTLIYGLSQNSWIPRQEEYPRTKFEPKKGILSVLLGTVSGFITAVLPGIGASTAAAISSSVKKENDARNFLVMIGSISTVNFFMSIAALSVLGKARNGAIIAVKALMAEPSSTLLIFSALIAGGIAVFVALNISKHFLRAIQKVNYHTLIKVVIISLVILTFVLSGLRGWMVLIIATGIGLYANWKGISRNAMMACIMVPVMSYFLI